MYKQYARLLVTLGCVIAAVAGSAYAQDNVHLRKNSSTPLTSTPGYNTTFVSTVAITGAFSSSVSFWSRREFVVGAVPEFIAVADLNGDGIPDFAVTNRDSNNVSVLLGNGDGTFQAAKNFPVGIQPFSIAVADFNGDAKLDLAVANFISNSVSLLLGNGNGTFQPAMSIPGSFPGAFSVVTNDLNGDGNLDLVVANANANSMSVLLGNGDGSFQPARNFNVGGSPVANRQNSQTHV